MLLVHSLTSLSMLNMHILYFFYIILICLYSFILFDNSVVFWDLSMQDIFGPTLMHIPVGSFSIAFFR